MRIWRRRSIGFRWRLRRLLKLQSPAVADWLARYPSGSDVLQLTLRELARGPKPGRSYPATSSSSF
jgi:hypothetical protein